MDGPPLFSVARLFDAENPNNQMYGHARILREYCSRRITVPIPGLLQHGWSYGPGVDPGDLEHVNKLPSHRLFLWNQRNVQVCKELGQDRVLLIGAPLLYLPEPDQLAPAKPKSLLLFPAHSCEWEPFVNEASDLYREYFEELRPIIESFDSTTVCLYWREFEDEKVRGLIEEMDFEVTTVGHRDNNPGFVSRLRTLILAHEYVSTNSYSTALFYSLFLNRKAFVYGNTFVSRLVPGKTDNLSIHDAMRRRYPQLDWENFNDTSHNDIGAEEIGASFRLPPEKLRHEFGWTTARQLKSIGRRLVVAARRRMRW
jgi:hypothetical protein